MTLYQINVFCFISLQHYDSALGSKSWGLGTIEIWPGSEADSYFCIKLLSQVWCSELLRWPLHIWSQPKVSVLGSHAENAVNASN